MQQPDLVLAKRQDVEVAVAGKEGQQRFEMKTVRDHHQFLERERKAIGMKLFWRKEYRQTVALVPPEARFLQ